MVPLLVLDVFTKNIFVLKAPDASLLLSDDKGCDSLSVNFQDNSSRMSAFGTGILGMVKIQMPKTREQFCLTALDLMKLHFRFNLPKDAKTILAIPLKSLCLQLSIFPQRLYVRD